MSSENDIASLFILANEQKIKDLFSDSLTNYEKLIQSCRSSPIDLSRAYEGVASVNEELGLVDKSLDYYLKSYEIKLELFGIESNELITLLIHLGRIQYKKADLASALGYLNSALKIADKDSNKINKNYYECQVNFGVVYCKIGKRQQAEDAFNFALKISLELNNKHESNADTADVYFYLGNYHLQFCNIKKATLYHEKALHIRGLYLGKTHSKYASSLHQLAILAMNESYLEKSKDYFEKSLEIKLKVFGYNHPSTATTLNLLGNLFDELGNVNLAFENKKKALEIRQEILGENHPDFAVSLTHFANSLHKMGNLQTAVEFLKKAITILTKNYGNYHRNLISPYFSLIDVYLDQENYQEAIDMMEILTKINSDNYGENHIQTSLIYNQTGRIFFETNKVSESLALFNKALKIQQGLYDNHDHACMINTHSLIGHCLKKMGEYKSALISLEKVLFLTKKFKGDKGIEGCKILYAISEIYLEMEKEAEYKVNLKNTFKLATEFIVRNSKDNQDPDIKIFNINFFNQLGISLEKADFSDDALFLYNYSLDQMKKANMENHLLTATLYNNIALCYLKQNKEKQLSIEHLLRALAIRENLSDPTDLELANNYHNLGLLYKEEEQFDNALIQLKKALDVRETLYGSFDSELLNELRIMAQIYGDIKNVDMQSRVISRIKGIEEENS